MFIILEKIKDDYLFDKMNKELIKKILGKKGTKIARSIKNAPKQKIITIHKNGKTFRVAGKGRSEVWKEVQNDVREPNTYKILETFLDKNHSYIDIGAWIGSTVLYGCQLAKHCYAIEPDPVAFEELKKNINLNNNLASKISLSTLCISDSVGVTKLFTNWDMLYVEGGASTSSIFEKSSGKFWEVKTTTFEKFIQSFEVNDCNFIKMDIEGAEFKILPTMKKYLEKNSPTLLIEIHPMFFKNYSEQLSKIVPILEWYKTIYDENLKKIDVDSLFHIDISKTFHVVLSNKTI